MTIDQKDLLNARNKLRNCVIGFWCCAIAIMPVSLMFQTDKSYIFQLVGGVIALIISCAFFFFAISIIFRSRFVLNKMNKMAWLWQVGIILIPVGLGFLIIPLVVMNRADKFLATQGSF